MPLWAYLLACWLALSILRVRTFLEHQAHERAGARSVDHRGPRAAGADLPQQQFPRRAPRAPEPALVPASRANTPAGATSSCAATTATATAPTPRCSRRYLLRRKDPVAHPIWTRRPSGGPSCTRYRTPLGDDRRRRRPADVRLAGGRAGHRPALGGLRDALRAAGVAAPDRLTRDARPRRSGSTRTSCSARACGLPLVRGLAGRVALVGAPDYGVPGCPPGLLPERGGGARRRPPRHARRLPRRPAGDQRAATRSRATGAILHHAAPLRRRRPLLRRRDGHRRPRRLDPARSPRATPTSPPSTRSPGASPAGSCPQPPGCGC